MATKLGCLFAEVTSVSGDSVDKAFEMIISEIDLSQGEAIEKPKKGGSNGDKKCCSIQ